MQLIDEELKRLDFWLCQQTDEKSNQKLIFAVQKQSHLLTSFYFRKLFFCKIKTF